MPQDAASAAAGSGRAESGAFDAIVVGSGFSGIAMGVELQRAGIGSFVILERSAGPGGTWRDNRYPGAACDIPAHLYSFSFEPNPGWTRRFAPQAEIRAYLEHCIRKFGLAGRIRYGERVESACYDTEQAQWEVTTRGGRRWLARALVLGIGPLSNPALPGIPGLDEFAGATFHSARWPEGWSAAGRRVAVIGTGASAIQIVPGLAGKARQVTVFQRTPPWILPRRDRAIPAAMRAFLRTHPLLHRLYRAGIYSRFESRALGFALHKSLLAPARWMALAFLRREVADPALRRALTPDYPIGCKRILLSDDYYRSLQRPDVDLVTAGIERVTRTGIRTVDGIDHAADCIVLATGFAATEYLSTIDVTGLDGTPLSQPKVGLPSAYLGIVVKGFPNLFLLMGPNTGLGHNSMVFMIEAQARYVRQAIVELLARNRRALEVRREVQSRFEAGIRRRLARSVWNSGCRSWYLKEGHNPVIWPGFTFEYWWRTRRLRRADFDR